MYVHIFFKIGEIIYVSCTLLFVWYFTCHATFVEEVIQFALHAYIYKAVFAKSGKPLSYLFNTQP